MIKRIRKFLASILNSQKKPNDQLPEYMSSTDIYQELISQEPTNALKENRCELLLTELVGERRQLRSIDFGCEGIDESLVKFLLKEKEKYKLLKERDLLLENLNHDASTKKKIPSEKEKSFESFTYYQLALFYFYLIDAGIEKEIRGSQKKKHEIAERHGKNSPKQFEMTLNVILNDEKEKKRPNKINDIEKILPVLSLYPAAYTKAVKDLEEAKFRNPLT